MKTSEVLHKAADLIEERGWIQVQGWPSGDTTEPLCLEGALMAALGLRMFDENRAEAVDVYDAFTVCPAYNAVKHYLDERFRLYYWNDARERTQAEVIEVLRATAAVEELEEAAARGPLSTGPTVRVPAPRPPVVSGVVGAGHRSVAEVGAK